MSDELKAPSEASQRVLCKLYLHKGDSYKECPLCGQQHESIDEMFDRVSFSHVEYREMLSAFDFLPNSPTMFNAGGLGTLSACFKFDVDDTMESILEVGRRSALVQKWGGGVGYCLSALRPEGAPIRSTHGRACGPVAVMYMYHAIAEMITQGGKRSGAQMAILHCDHPDILKFVRSKEREGVLDTFNISVAVTDEFMRGVANTGGNELFDEIVKRAWTNGDPGLYFIDAAERANSTPALGELTGTNPCYVHDSLVATSVGLVRIQNLTTSERAYVGEGKFEDIVRVFDVGKKSTVRVTAKRNYENVVTPEQEMYVKDRGIVLAKNLKLGDVLVLQDFGYLLPGGSRELGRIAGWLTGDGGCNDNRTYASISERDVPIVEEKLLPLIERHFPSRMSSRAKIRTFKQRSGNLGYQYMTGVRSLYDFVRRTCTKDKVSDELLSGGREFIRGFIECLFFADGHAELGGGMRQLALTCRNKRFAQDVRIVLLQFGIKTSLYNVPRTGHESDVYYGFEEPQPGYRVQLGGVDRKKFLEEFGFLEFRPDLAGVFENIETYQSSREYEVTAVEDGGVQHVYDFTTSGKRLVFVDGIRSRECGEVPLLDNESCNLGSINLSHFVAEKGFDLERLGRVVRFAVMYLDDVIEHNFYPVEAVREATLRTRKLGLGVMGWADALAMLQVPYDSAAAVDIGSEVMQFIQAEAHDMSEVLRTGRGPCPADASKRNMCVTCIAPAGTISTVADCSSGIEPHFSLEYMQAMGDGEELHRRVSFGDFVPKVASEVSWEWHVRHQAAFQRFTDLAVSKTINMPHSATEEDVRGAYLTAWELGCKGVTVYREGSRVKQALSKGGSESYVTDMQFGGRRKLRRDGISLRHKFDVGDVEGYLHIGLYEGGQPGEVFITGVKQGSTISGLLDGIAILTSLALQRGVPLEEMVSKLQGTKFEPAGLTQNETIPTTTSLLDYIFRYMQLRCNGQEVASPEYSGMLCPGCGAAIKFQEGCMYCSKDCGWSRC